MIGARPARVDDQPIGRVAARRFLLDPAHRPLLVHSRRDVGSEVSHRITPGGGGEAGAAGAPAGHTDIERQAVSGHRWWRLDEFDLAAVDREPATMVEVIRQVLAAGV